MGILSVPAEDASLISSGRRFTRLTQQIRSTNMILAIVSNIIKKLTPEKRNYQTFFSCSVE